MNDLDKRLAYILAFKDLIKMINDELKEKKIYDCEYMLITHSVEEVFCVLEENSIKYQYIKDELIGGFTFKSFLEWYFYQVKDYYDSLMIKEGRKDIVADHYYHSLKESTDRIYPKESIKMIPQDIEKTLHLMKEAVEVYYKVYENKELIAELSTSNPDVSEILNFRIREKNLLHLLGVTSRQLIANPDFQRLTGKKITRSEDILNWILRDIDGNKDLVQYEEDFIKKIANNPSFAITTEQFNPLTTTKLLNYDKIRSKSQTFLKYGPFENVSLVAKLQNGKTLSQNSKSTGAMITRAESFRKYPWAYFGRVEKGNDSYIETLQIDDDSHKKELLKGSRAAIVKSIKNIDDATGEGSKRIFSEEEQINLFLQAYESFSRVMDFQELITYFKNLQERYEKKSGKTR